MDPIVALAAVYAVAGAVYLLRRPLRRARMATLKRATSAGATVKKTAAGVVKKKAPAKKSAAATIPKVTAADVVGSVRDEPWMTPAIKKARTDYYAATVDAINAAIEAAVARFKAEPTAKWAFHLHHEGLLEPLRGDDGDTGVKGALERIKYVATDKGFTELLARFRVMRPVPQDRIVELQEATKAAVAEETPPKVEPHRILRTEVEALDRVATEKRKAVDALNPKTAADAARKNVEDAWERFHVRSNGYYSSYSAVYRIGTQASLVDLLRYAKEWWDATHLEPDPAAVAAAKKELAEAEKARSDLNNEYYKQQSEREKARQAASRRVNSGAYADSSRPENVTEDQVWALHAELCEPDCPYTKTNKSVIPKTR